MKQIDKYIVKSYLFSLIVCLISLIGLYVVIDLFQKIDNFLKKKDDLLPMILEHYAWQIPFNLLQFLPIVTLVAAILTLTRLAKNNELAPMKGAGIPIHRVLLPMFLIAFAISGMIVLLQEWVIPASAERIQASRVSYHEDMRSANAQIIDEEGEDFNLSLYCATYSIAEQTMHKVSIDWDTKDYAPRQIGDFNSNRLSHAYADRVSWDGRVWRMQNDSGLCKEVDLAKRRNGAPDAARPIESGEVLDLHFTPAQIALKIRNSSMSLLGGANTQFLTTPQLKAYCDAHPFHRSERVALYQRAMLPLSNMILFMLGIPYVLRRESRSAMIGIGVAMLVSFAYYGIAIVCQSLGSTGVLEPFLAAILPTAAFLSIAIYNFDTVPT